jgi:hypothetical protein
LMRQYFKERRIEETEERKARFKYVRWVVQNNIVVDNNDIGKDLTSTWYASGNDDFLTENIQAAPALLKRLKRYVAWDARNISEETKQRARDIWNSLK